MSDPIRAALDAACATDAFFGMGNPVFDAECRERKAAAIAAFLRALPTCSIRFERYGGYGQKVLAAAVEEAADG
jgi:hypothetical protein